MRDFWTQERVAVLSAGIAAKKSARQVAAELHTTRNAVIGYAFRNGWRFHCPEPAPKPPKPPKVPREPRQSQPRARDRSEQLLRSAAREAKRLEARRLYLAGEKLHVIAEKSGLALGSLNPILRDLPKRRANGWSMEAKPREFRVEALALHFSGLSAAKAARKVGCGMASINNWKRANGPDVAEAKARAVVIVAERERLAREKAERDAAAVASAVAVANEVNAPILAAMPPRHRALMEARIGGATLREAGAVFGITRERVRQIEARYRASGLLRLNARPLSEAAIQRWAPKPAKQPRQEKPFAHPPAEWFAMAHAVIEGRKPRPRAYRITDAERQRRAEHCRTLAARRWAGAHQ